jgi:hypothetical protein
MPADRDSGSRSAAIGASMARDTILNENRSVLISKKTPGEFFSGVNLETIKTVYSAAAAPAGKCRKINS